MPDYTILIVDYEPRSITKLTSLFNGAGYHVEVARDGLSAIDKFQLLRPDLVVMEAMIPRTWISSLSAETPLEIISIPV